MCYNVSAMSTYTYFCTMHNNIIITYLYYILFIIIVHIVTVSSPRRSAVHFRRVDNRGHRLRVSAQVFHHSRGGLRHAIRPAHHHRGQYPPEETRRQ